MEKERAMNAADEFRKLVESVRDTHQSVAMELRVQFACLVTDRLRSKGWTQAKLAEVAENVPESSISEIVHADANCTFETIGKVLFALGVRGKLRAVGAEGVARREEDVGDTTARDVRVFAIIDQTESNKDGKKEDWLEDIEETGKETVEDNFFFAA